MAKLDDGFTIKMPKKGSNNLLLPIFAVCVFLFVSIALGMYLYEPDKNELATTNQATQIVNDVNQNSNTLVEKVQETKNILPDNSSAIENKNTSISKESAAEIPVQEFQQVLNFDFDSTEIKSYDAQALKKFLADNKDKKLKIIIDGHTDSVGNEDYNQDLSERRANSVEQELGQIASQQMDITKKITGYGETKPVDSNDSYEGRANNRRVELTIIVLP